MQSLMKIYIDHKEEKIKKKKMIQKENVINDKFIMTKYRKKPVTIEAFKWAADENQTEDPLWIVEAIRKGDVFFSNKGTENIKMHIKTLEGEMIANIGDYIIKGIKNELYPCKSDIFYQTYEKI